MAVKSNEELAQRWLKAMADVDSFPALCEPGCKVWHSYDNAWISVEESIARVHAAGGLPPLQDTSYTLIDGGFLVQFSAAIQGTAFHNTIIVKVRNGLAYSAQEYCGFEMDLAALLQPKV